jgi:hypothetical protein
MYDSSFKVPNSQSNRAIGTTKSESTFQFKNGILDDHRNNEDIDRCSNEENNEELNEENKQIQEFRHDYMSLSIFLILT